jgi:hypothetical protein
VEALAVAFGNAAAAGVLGLDPRLADAPERTEVDP